MQITPIVICLVLIPITQATFYRNRFFKPKLNFMHSWHFQHPGITKRILPEERRTFPLFTKKYMKYVISPEPLYDFATHKPIIHGTRKPVMKKLIIKDKSIAAVKYETQSEMNEPIYDNNLTGIPKVDRFVVSEEVSIEIDEDKSDESDEMQIVNIEEENKLQNANKEFETATTQTANRDPLNLKEIIFPPEVKLVEVSPEKISKETFSDVSDTIKTSKENEILDLKEFIFIDPVRSSTENNKINIEEPEEYVTTEIYEEPKIFRRKRGSNVIEEENLASTVAGYKYTWRDKRLNNDVIFKNINS